MKKNKKNFLIILVVLIVLIIISVWLFSQKNKKGIENNLNYNREENLSLINEFIYLCKDNKTIKAFFYEGLPQSVKPGDPPILLGKAEIILSDGRKFSLSQTISADGVRYANSDESFVFWSKGNGAIVLENNNEKDYVGCVILKDDPGGLENYYLDPDIGFTVRYPKNFKIDTSYKYQLSPDKEIKGVKFVISEDLSNSTNLSNYDTGISVETIYDTDNCSADLFFDTKVKKQEINKNNIDYSFASIDQGAAGNFYEELIYALPGTNPCIGIRYFIHSVNISNYPKGEILEFDKNYLLKQFNKIRDSLVLK